MLIKIFKSGINLSLKWKEIKRKIISPIKKRKDYSHSIIIASALSSFWLIIGSNLQNSLQNGLKNGKSKE